MPTNFHSFIKRYEKNALYEGNVLAKILNEDTGFIEIKDSFNIENEIMHRGRINLIFSKYGKISKKETHLINRVVSLSVVSAASRVKLFFFEIFQVENITENYGTDELTISWNNGMSIFFEQGLTVQQRLQQLNDFRYQNYIGDPIETFKPRSK